MEFERTIIKLTKDEVDCWNTTPAKNKPKLKSRPADNKPIVTPVEYQRKNVALNKEELVLWSYVSAENKKCKMMTAKIRGHPQQKIAKNTQETRPEIIAKKKENAQKSKKNRERDNLRHKNLEKLVLDCEKAVLAVKEELKKRVQWCKDIDNGNIPNECWKLLTESETLSQIPGEGQME